MAGRIRNIRIVANIQLEEDDSWSPAQLTSLKAWYKSDTGVSLNGAKVTQWNDQSGNSNHLTQATEDKQPGFSASQLNGYPAIVFDGVDDVLDTAAFTLNQPETVFIIFKQTTWTDNDTIFDGLGGNSGRLFQRTTTPNIGTYAGDFGPPSADLAVNTFGLITCILNGASSVLQVNNNAESTTGSVGSSNMGGFTLGDFGDGGAAANISVVEVIVMEAAASADERTSVKNYVSERYGISM